MRDLLHRFSVHVLRSSVRLKYQPFYMTIFTYLQESTINSIPKYHIFLYTYYLNSRKCSKNQTISGKPPLKAQNKKKPVKVS